jgi:hypothetical protein
MQDHIIQEGGSQMEVEGSSEMDGQQTSEARRQVISQETETMLMKILGQHRSRMKFDDWIDLGLAAVKKRQTRKKDTTKKETRRMPRNWATIKLTRIYLIVSPAA